MNALFLVCVIAIGSFVFKSGNKSEIPSFLQSASEGLIYFGAGIAFKSASDLAQFGSAICSILDHSQRRNEFQILSHLCNLGAHRAWGQLFKPSSFSNGTPLSLSSWHSNQTELSQIPAGSEEMKRLIGFLETRWLAKANGFFPSMVNWVFPCFNIFLQVHPLTTSCYARDPATLCSQTYTNRVEEWKQSFPFTRDFPLILTRPCNLENYLPFYVNGSKTETALDEASLLKNQSSDSKAIVDLTSIFPDDQKEWNPIWDTFRTEFLEGCKRRDLNPDLIVCIQRIQEGDLGGIRLLPLIPSDSKGTDQHHKYLLEWISRFGFTANQVELDRLQSKPRFTEVKEAFSALGGLIPTFKKEEFISYIDAFEKNWKSTSLEKNLMVQGELNVLKGLLAAVSKEKWDEIIHCPTRSAVLKLSFLKIKEQLEILAEEGDRKTFFDLVLNLEQIHSNFSSLLEILSPFCTSDFASIYHKRLTSIPENLKSLTSCTIHTAAMASLAGILKAVEMTAGEIPRVAFGENTYFENIMIAKRISKTSYVDEIEEGDWGRIDLILAQFDPVLKRLDLDPIEYRVEKIAETVRKALNARQRSLTLAIDCTLDYINSSRIQSLLEEFQKQIDEGALNVVCYRSGLKYDLFGMDNFSGAPLYMIHSKDPKWAAFDHLLTDPAIQTDRLSLNWFCLAYQCAAIQLELYRKVIFENTRSLLNKLPPRLYSDRSDYRIVPIEQGANPGFIDIRIFGPYHQIRGAALVCGSLFTECFEGGHPIFTRRSLGFYHPNFSIIFGKHNSTIRLTVGLDPGQVDLLVKCFEQIDALNGP